MIYLSNIIEMCIYILIGLMFCLIGYKLQGFIYRKYFKLTEEVDNGNKAVGIMISGMFIAISIIMSGVL